MADDTDSQLSIRTTPHIRLNSGRQEPYVDLEEGTRELEHRLSNRSHRSLAPPERRSTVVTTAPVPSPPIVSPTDSSELLFPRPRKVRSRGSPDRSTLISAISYQSNSWESHSDAGSRDTYDPFVDSTCPSRADSDDENVNTQTVSEKYNIMPTEGLLLFPEDVEKDDYLHNPDATDRERVCDMCNTRGVFNVGGLVFLTIGIVALFIVYPVTTFVGKMFEPPYDPCNEDPMCLDNNRPLLKNVRTGLIDPTTPKSAMSKTSADGTEWKLVFSDEFNVPGRTFYDGDDPFFQGVDLWYGVTQDLEWYDPDAITTKDGVLEIRFDPYDNHNLKFRSGMLQSWNKMCFSGGRLEASISLPGQGDISGFWPGFWAMGNLGRAGYAATTDGMWPYSYHDECDVGITANQSSPDGISFLPGMRLPACSCPGADHPSPGKSRGAPEIDVIEASVTVLDQFEDRIGVVSQSLQLAPYDIWYMPNYDFTAVYDPRITSINSYRGGPFQEVASGLTNLNNDWYNGKEYQIYAFEYTPGSEGDVTWFVGSDKTWTLDARAIGANGNIGQRVIPTEPMYPILNFGISNSFAMINWTGLATTFPATMRVDYLRIYQNPDNISITCDPEDYPTTEYIKKHPEPYNNPNLTFWSDVYDWPENSFVHGC
ncbi:Beta-glucan synthesis-associated protein SKN1 [Talaromyces islandicus]|uniref:Beta-glucan synthesis-associated protein SKN1 n=1 Tax=Talaromyces islandicus TaxID=28573 RepID=A0A0U1M0R1_TALIS|nr:Beta-glucan synthesis-associated protein SKN1 [Talaromyces islandicus]